MEINESVLTRVWGTESVDFKWVHYLKTVRDVTIFISIYEYSKTGSIRNIDWIDQNSTKETRQCFVGWVVMW